MSTILWQDITNGALDRCRLGVTPSGLRMAGTVLTAAHGDPLEVRYLVTTDEKGRTRRVELDLDNGSTRRVLLADGAGRWNWDGDPELTDVAGLSTSTSPSLRRPTRFPFAASDSKSAKPQTCVWHGCSSQALR